ncbi:hypothetical protein BY996DRAFT_4582895, partial [Phakopsora pachyrhizi]
IPKDMLSVTLDDFVIKAQQEAISKRSKFILGISGGLLANTLVEVLNQRSKVKWDRWIFLFSFFFILTLMCIKRVVFFSDERVVPLEQQDPNYKIVHKGFFIKVPIPRGNNHAILTDHMYYPTEVTHEYEKQLMNKFYGNSSAAFSRFNLVLLGKEPNGHACLLSPKHLLMAEDFA